MTLTRKSYLQDLCHNSHITKSSVRTTTPYDKVGSGYYFTQLLTKNKGYDLVPDCIAKVKVTVKICVFTLYPYCVKSDFDNIYLTKLFVVHDPYVCNDIDQMSYLQGQDHGANETKNQCSGHYCLLSCWIWIAFFTNFIHDQRLCHDFNSK